jgi:hypothetical protein
MSIKVVPITEADYLVQIVGFGTGFWETFSGLNDSANSVDYSDGQRNRLYKLVGPRQIDDVTLTKPFNPVDDKNIVDWWRAWCNSTGEELTVSVQPVRYCPEPTPYGEPIILLGCKPAGLSIGKVDKKSNNVSTLELKLSVDDYTFGTAATSFSQLRDLGQTARSILNQGANTVLDAIRGIG